MCLHKECCVSVNKNRFLEYVYIGKDFLEKIDQWLCMP